MVNNNYVGETGQSFNKTINHRADVIHKLEKPASAHFNIPKHSIDDLKVVIIKQMKTNPIPRKIHES